ncbi:hypothetical protein GCM10009591_18260 [Brachybacterium tyrofermentans]
MVRRPWGRPVHLRGLGECEEATTTWSHRSFRSKSRPAPQLIRFYGTGPTDSAETNTLATFTAAPVMAALPGSW